MDHQRPSTSTGTSRSTCPRTAYRTRPQVDILPDEEGPVCPEKTCLPTIYLGSVSVNGQYTRKVWKKDRDMVKSYYRGYGKFYHGTFCESDAGIRCLGRYVDKLVKMGHQSIRIVYSGEVNSNGNKDNRLIFEKGRDLSVRGLVNFMLARGMSTIELVIVSLHSFIWADVLGLKLDEGKSLTVYYPPYVLPTNLEDTTLDMFTKNGTTAFKKWDFFKAVYKI